MCKYLNDKKFLKELLSVVIMALLIVAMYLILMYVPESFKNSIKGYFFLLFIVILVLVLLVLIMKKILFKDENLDGALKVFEIFDSLADLLSVILLYFGISTESWANTEMLFLGIVCFKLFYISLSIIESDFFNGFCKKSREIIDYVLSNILSTFD